MKSNAILLLIFLQYFSISYSQNIIIANKSFTIIKSTILYKQTEFYSVKNSANPNALSENYIKFKGTFNKTSFSESELISFYKTKSISALGVLSDIKISGTNTINGIKKNKLFIIFSVSNGILTVHEFNEADFIMALDNGGGLTPAQESCGRDAGANWQACRGNCTQKWPVDDANRDQCKSGCTDTLASDLDKCLALRGKPGANSYKIDVSGFGIKLR